MKKKIKVALLYPPYNNEKYAFFSLAYLIGGLRKQAKDAEFKLFDAPAMDTTAPPSTETERIPSVNPFNSYMVMTPEILRIS